MQAPSLSERRRRRIPLRMSLRVFMALVVLVGVVLGRVVHRAQVQRQAVVAIERANGIVCYDWQWKDGQVFANVKPWAPGWLVDRIGVDYFGSITLVNLMLPESDAEPLLSQIEHFDQLEELSLDGPGVTDAALVHLAGLSRLKVLDLGDTRISDAGLVHLEGLTELQDLSLAFSGARISDAGLAHLKGLTKLQNLNLMGLARVGDAGLAHLKGLTRLQWLDLADTGVSDAGLVNLKGLTQLRTLNLRKTRDLIPPPPPLPELGGAGLDDFEAVERRFLEAARVPVPHFRGSSISDAGLAYLQGLSRLQELDLGGTAVSDDGLVRLKALAQLKVLNLAHTDVSDACLTHLKPLTRLQELDLTGTRVSAAGVNQLRQDLPKTTVDYHKMHVL